MIHLVADELRWNEMRQRQLALDFMELNNLVEQLTTRVAQSEHGQSPWHPTRVIYSELDTRAVMSDDIESVVNLGPKSAQWLRDVGITSRAKLEQLGAVVAYRIVKRRHPRASLNLLWALAAGLQGKDWRELGDDEKQRLRRELEA